MKNHPIVAAALSCGLARGEHSPFAYALGALAESSPAKAQHLVSAAATEAERVGAVLAYQRLDAATVLEFARAFGCSEPIKELASSFGIRTNNGTSEFSTVLLEREAKVLGVDAGQVAQFARVFGLKGDVGEAISRMRR